MSKLSISPETLFLNDPVQGSKDFFSTSPSKEQIWKLLEFLVWSHQDKVQYPELFEWFKELASAGQGFKKTFLENQQKGVCGKEIKRREPVYKCNNCAADSTCIQCVECYENSDHTGHDVKRIFASGGCCDCGDPESWAPKGFCKFHQGPAAAAKNIRLDPKVETPCRLVCGYMIYLLSHAFSSDHHDVVYLPVRICQESLYYKQYVKHKKELHNKFSEFPKLLTSINDRDEILMFHNDENHTFDDVKEYARTSLTCSDEDGLEIAWRLQMLEKTYLAVSSKSVLQRVKSVWERNNMQTSVVNVDTNEYVRVLSNDFIQGMLECIGSWMSSEVMQRVISQCLMQDIDKLGHWDDAFYNIRSMEVEIPGWIDDGKEWNEEPTHSNLGDFVPSDYHNRYKTKEFIHETKTPIWYFIMNDYAMGTNYREALNEMWFALMCIPPFKHRMCQVFTFTYQKLATNLGILDRQDSFFSLSVQLFTIPTMTCAVSRTHNLLEVVMNCFMHFLCNTSPPSLKTGPGNQNTFNFPITDGNGNFKAKLNTMDRDNETRRFFAIAYDIKYILTNDTVVPYLFTYRPDIIKKWCQVLCLLQNVCDIHREVGDHVGFDTRLWKGAFDFCLRVFPVSRIIISTIYRLLLAPTTTPQLKQKILDVLADVIGEALVMIDARSWDHLMVNLNIPAPTIPPISTISSTSTTRPSAAAVEPQPGAEGVDFDDIYGEGSAKESGLPTENENKSENINISDQKDKKKYETALIALKTLETNQETLIINFFRTDRDRLSVFIPLSRFIVNLAAVYCQTSGRSFAKLIENIENLTTNKQNGKEEKEEENNKSKINGYNEYLQIFMNQFMKISAFVSQTHSDLWLKNGNDVQHIVHNYERIELYWQLKGDDIGGLHYALEWHKPSDFMAKILYFYQLHDWFRSNATIPIIPEDEHWSQKRTELLDIFESGWVHWCDNQRTLRMVEELLTNLISFISEPRYRIRRAIDPKNDSKDEKDHKEEKDEKTNQNETNTETWFTEEQKWLEYELVHWLVLDKATYSELNDKISVLDEEMECAGMLERIAIYEAPQGMENAKYRLKDEYYAKFNPYFHKYTTEERQHALEAVANKLKQLPNVDSSNSKNKQEENEEMLTSQWPTVEYSDEYMLGLLSVPWMGTLWACLLHHIFVNDTKRFTQNAFVHCLRLIALATEALIRSKVSKDSKIFHGIINNFTNRFDFRLTTRLDHCEHEEAVKNRARARREEARRRLEAERSGSGENDELERREIQILGDHLNEIGGAQITQLLARLQMQRDDRFSSRELLELMRSLERRLPGQRSRTNRSQTNNNDKDKDKDTSKALEEFSISKDTIVPLSRKQLDWLRDVDSKTRKNVESDSAPIHPSNSEDKKELESLFEPGSSKETVEQRYSETHVANNEIKEKNLLSSTQVDLPPGVGSVAWYLCQLLIRISAKQSEALVINEIKQDWAISPQMQKSSKLLLEQILSRWHDLGVTTLTNAIIPYWTPPQTTLGKSEKKKPKSDARAKKLQKAREKAMKAMKAQKKLFEDLNKKIIEDDVIREEKEEKELMSSCGVGLKYECIVCRSREKEDEMGLIAFASRSTTLHQCVDNPCEVFSNLKNPSNNEKIVEKGIDLMHRKGIQWTFCGHAVHFACFETYMHQIHEKDVNDEFYFGMPTLRLSHHEFVCPYCKTMSNLLMPLQSVYRNPQLHNLSLRMCGEKGIVKPEETFFANIPESVSSRQSISEIKPNQDNQNSSSQDVDMIDKYGSNENKTAETDLKTILTEHMTERHKKLINEFFLCLNNMLYYLNEDAQDAEDFGWKKYRNIPKPTQDALLPIMLCDILSYSISGFETRFRSYSRQEIQDKLPRALQLNNTSISNVWGLFSLHDLQKKIDAAPSKEKSNTSSIWHLLNKLFKKTPDTDHSSLFSDKGMEWLYQSCWVYLAELFGQLSGPENEKEMAVENKNETENDEDDSLKASIGDTSHRAIKRKRPLTNEKEKMKVDDKDSPNETGSSSAFSITSSPSKRRRIADSASTNTQNEDITSDDSMVKTQEPFNVVVRALLTHPNIFVLTKKSKSDFSTSNLMALSNKSEESSMSLTTSSDIIQSVNINGITIINDIYHVLLSCYLWKILQVLISDMLVKNKSQSQENIKQSASQWMEDLKKKTSGYENMQNTMEYLAYHVLPFLRKCYILLYSSGLVELDVNVLWSSVPSEKSVLAKISATYNQNGYIYPIADVIAECDDICANLFLPTLKEYVASTFGGDEKTNEENYQPLTIESDKSKKNILQIMKNWTQRYLQDLNEKELKYIESTYEVDSVRPVLLAKLPQQFDPIFKRACKEECSGRKFPEKSALCLFCGKFLCIDCCRSRRKGALTIHSKQCGSGKGVFLWLQTSCIIMIYEHAAAVFNSPYLDSHGEEDNGLKRGNLLSLNDMRLHEICKLVADEAIPNKVCQLRSGGRYYERNWF